MYGLAMVSDAGIAAAIVRDKRGDDSDFLDAVWTLQVCRGLLLWGGACTLAYPLASLYSVEQLATIIPVAALALPISGLGSTALHTCRRHMHLGPIVALEVTHEVIVLAVTIPWAFLAPTVWALVGGTLAGSVFTAIASHLALPRRTHRISWNWPLIQQQLSFGRWIFLSSMMFFVAGQADRLMLGYLVPMSQLGVYSVALVLSEAVYAVISRINRDVAYPAYGKTFRNDPVRLEQVVARTRFGVDVLLVAPIAILVVCAEWIIALLYDSRYHEAGWMLQVLCVRLLLAATLMNSEASLVAAGHPQYSVAMNVGRLGWILACIPLGWHVAGIRGVIWAVALSELPVLVVLWLGMKRNRLFSPSVELRSALFAAVGLALGNALLALLLKVRPL